MTMTAEAKRALSSTIRSLRARLLEDLHAATESAYRLSVRTRDAGLAEAARVRRGRLEGWLDEQYRADAERGKGRRTQEEFRREVEKQAAYTLLNRLVILRLMEALGPDGTPMRAPAVVTGGWESKGYKDLRSLAPALVRGDETEGYAFVLRLVFEELAAELPGVFGPAGVADLVPIPAATVRHVIEALDQPELASCWSDDMTLGWVYQYWNDPEREALDAKLHSGGKVEPHEIASKTQMFTERYMVDWLLQNSLGPMWLAMCKKHGWIPEVEADGTLAVLEARRVEWRAKRGAGEVSLTELMPLHTDSERRWAYYVPQPIPDGAVEHAPDSVRELKILDPAVGSGHFLVVAFDLLVALYHEEARHRGEAGRAEWTDRSIVERILEQNLHGIDLDPRAVQIAAAALWLKARQLVPEARPEQLNLVASNLRLGSLPDDDPALAELRREVERETGIPGELTDTIVNALRGADHLGSLLKVDAAVDQAIEEHEKRLATTFAATQTTMFEPPPAQQATLDFSAAAARRSLIDRLESFLARHTGGEDLGLRLRGEQLAAGVRFVRLVKEGGYDLVVANPPYQGTTKMVESKYVEKHYPLGKADLYAAFLLRGLELVRAGGVSAMLTMRNWMFIGQFAGLRKYLLHDQTLAALGDLSWGAFREMRDNPVAMSVVLRGRLARPALAVAPTDPQDRIRTREEFAKKQAGLLCHVGRHDFDPAALKVVPEWPLVYWWSRCFLDEYAGADRLGTRARVRYGLSTQNNVRWLRSPWEIGRSKTMIRSFDVDEGWDQSPWVPYIKGAAGSRWMDPVSDVLLWRLAGCELWAYPENRWGRGTDFYFKRGVAFVNIGASFSARAHRMQSIFGHVAGSVFDISPAEAVCMLNSRKARDIMESLNPTLHFLTSDVERLPLSPIEGADRIFTVVETAFAEQESHREPSIEFHLPGASPWRQTQHWAQTAVDRANGEALPAYEPEYDPEPPNHHLSFSLGVALGRFGEKGGGILDPHTDDLSHALPKGILFLDGTQDAEDYHDGLGEKGAAPLHSAWKEYWPAIGTNRKSLRDWLALDFFKDVHKGMYENRPIHWPLSSEKRTFVAWVNIHRMNEQTLRFLLADHLNPALARLEGRLADLRAARDGADKKAARAAEKQYDKVVKARDELQIFIADVEQCADRGPLPTDAKCPPREVDARYAPDLDDGVMINSAALWKLLEPQWKDPKKWWKQLATSQGKKDYDWSHLAMRYFPTRVDEKCQQDPSLGVAHGCFWRYHAARAWAWELRLQDEIGPDFRIEEAPYRGEGGHDVYRAAYLRDQPAEALEAVEKEVLRRRRKAKQPQATLTLLESGLWSSSPELCWALELRVTEKQGAELRLLAPDEPESRAGFEKAHPEEVCRREDVLAKLEPEASLFDDEPGEDAGDEDADVDPDSDETEEAEA